MHQPITVEQLEATRAQTESALAATRADFDRTSLQLATSDTKLLRDKATKLEAEITGYESALKRLDAARRALEQQHLDEAARAEQRAFDDAKADAIAAIERHVDAAAAITKILADFGRALVELDAATESARLALWTAAGLARPHSLDARGALAVSLQAHLASVTHGVLTGLNQAVHRTSLHHSCSINVGTDSAISTEAIATKTLGMARRTLARWAIDDGSEPDYVTATDLRAGPVIRLKNGLMVVVGSERVAPN